MKRKNREKDWEDYWAESKKRFLYDFIASFYRNFIIKGSLDSFLFKYFGKRDKLLHAGSGGGEVDKDARRVLDITAVDFSENALKQYKKNYGKYVKVVRADISEMPFKEKTFDGIYNLGVFEHYERKEVDEILKEFRRVLKDNGKLIIFWPPEYGLSVRFFKLLKIFWKIFLNKPDAKFHPDEIFRLESEEQARKVFQDRGFKVIEYYFGPRDAFTYAVIVAEKN